MNVQAVSLLWCCAHMCESLGLQGSNCTLLTLTKKVKYPKESFPEAFCLSEHVGVL